MNETVPPRRASICNRFSRRGGGARWTSGAALVLATGLLVACNTLDDAELAERADAGVTDASPVDAQSDARVDTSVDSEGVDDVLRDTAGDSGDSGDATTDTGGVNACGGQRALLADGEAVEPGDDCGPCGDGVIICNGPNDVRCAHATLRNACGGCAPLVGEPAAECGRCGEGAWTCTEAGEVECVDAVPVNECGGCEELPGEPGFACTRASGTAPDGLWACSGPESTVCVGRDTNACGGVERLRPAVGTVCGRCGQGVVVCDGANAVRCHDEEAGQNACGGCGPLRGVPGEGCGLCDGTWACDGENHVVCDEPGRNACGGCEPLDGEPGASCGDGVFWRCDGVDAVSCPEVTGNACGGERVLAAPPGEVCGECEDGFTLCTSPDAVACVGGSDRNECDGCGTLPAEPGAPCGRGLAWACTDDGAIACVESGDRNACGGVGELAGVPGAACGLCDTGRWVCATADEVTCAGEDPDATDEYWPDLDGDGFGDGDAEAESLCEPPPALVANGDDCDDSYELSHPGAPELCDSRDNDCDGAIDEDVVPLEFYPDLDGDGFGDPGREPVEDCAPPEGRVYNADDCDDTDGATFPGAAELCDGVDNDCDGVQDEGVSNACGGCAELETEPGALCGPCALDLVVCESGDRTVCDGATPCPAEEVTTGDVTDIGTSRATVHGELVVPPVEGSDHGFCWATEPLPDLDDDCVSLGVPGSEGPFDTTIESLLPGRAYHVRAFYVPAGASPLFGNQVTFETLRPPPMGVEASDGTDAERIVVAWDAVAGATGYLVHRDGEMIAEVGEDVTEHDDSDATPAPPPARPRDVSATDGERVDAVVLSWTAPAPVAGAAHRYRVAALYPVGPSEPSAIAVGRRAPREITSYEVEHDGAAWLDVGLVSSWEDDAAPAPRVDGGRAIASDGGSAAFVSVDLVSASGQAGAPRAYRVRALVGDQPGEPSTTVSGRRGVGELEIAWLRSMTDEPADYEALAGKTGASIQDETAPADGAGRYYVASVRADGAEEALSEPDRGYRSALPTVRTGAVTLVGERTATVDVIVDAPGVPPADAHGLCWGNREDPSPTDGVSRCADLGGIGAPGAVRTVTLDELAPGATIYVRAYATNAAGTAFGDERAIDILPRAPTGVEASDATDRDHVVVEWTSVPTAIAYRVYRDGELVDEVSSTMLLDTGASPGGVPTAVGLTPSASEGSSAEHVVVRWDTAEVPDGATHVYTVTAVNAAGEGAPSEADDGSRGAAPIERYDVEVGGVWRDAGDTTEYLDTEASPGSITAAIAAASDGTSPDFVALTLSSGGETVPGPDHTYRVRAVNAAGEGEPSELVSGYRGVGTPSYSWERSAGDADEAYSTLESATTRSFEDVTAPVDGAGRYYRCRISAAGAAAIVSASDRGFRNARLPGVRTVRPTEITGASATLHGEIVSLGTPPATDHGFCWGTGTNPSADDGTSSCSSNGAVDGPGSFERALSGLRAGTTYHVRAWAQNDAGRSYGGDVAFTTRPPAPEGVTASDGTSDLFVQVGWNASPGATSYEIFRDDVSVGTTVGVSWTDSAAGEGDAPLGDLSPLASDATVFDRVQIVWSRPTVPAGPTHEYEVIARNDAGSSPRSASDTGFREGAPVTGYEIQIDGGTWQAVEGGDTVYDDLAAEAGEIVAGTVTASDGASEAAVELAIDGSETLLGTERSYAVRAVNAVGMGTSSETVTGRRGVGALAYQWERSTTAVDDDWAGLVGATGPSHTDTSAPADGSVRHYRVALSAEGADAIVSGSDSGFRRALPQVRTDAASSIAVSSIVANGTLLTLGGPPAGAHGFCWAQTAAPTLDTALGCVDLGSAAAPGGFASELTSLSAGTAYVVRAFATNEAGTVYGDDVSFSTLPASPTDVSASDGTDSGAVFVEWSLADGVDRYEVYRDGELVEDDALPGYADTGASMGGPPSSEGLAVEATAGSRSDGVLVSWSVPDAPPGATHEYTVVAVNGSGSSVPSTPDEGHRAAFPVTGYDVEVDGSVVSLDETGSYLDETAPSGTISPGAATASDGTSAAFVALTLDGVETTGGAPVDYRVRGLSEAGSGEFSEIVSGHRGVGTISYQWQRSSGDGDSGYTNIPGATTATYEDTGAPEDGAGRYYRCEVDAEGAPSATTGADRGFRNATLPEVTTGSVSFSESGDVSFSGFIFSRGTPELDALGFCWSTAPNPSIEGAECVDVGADWTSSFPHTVTDLEPATEYYVRAWARNAVGVAYGGQVSFVTAPPPPMNVSASDGTSTEHVVITWDPVADEALGITYRLFRDGEDLGTVSAPFEDGGASAAGPPSAAGLDASASDGTSTAFVQLDWSEPSTPPGATHEYTVVAFNDAGESDASSPDTGFRALYPVTGYETRLAGAAEWTDAGVATSHLYFDAPAPTVDPGVASASDGTSPASVSLSLAGVSIAAGDTATFEVRAINAAGAGETASDTGFRGAGVPTYQWQRSADDSDSGYVDIAGATAATYEDSGAPEDGTGRFYRCRVAAEGAASMSSVSDRGFVAVLVDVESRGVHGRTLTSAELEANLLAAGPPEPDAHGFCWATTSSPAVGGDAVTCSDLGPASSTTGIFTGTATGLSPATRYYARPYATNSAGTAYGSDIPIMGDSCYVDADGDGYRTDSFILSDDLDCDDAGEAWADEPAGDCRDDDEAQNPAAEELCGDETDNDCDGKSDEACFAYPEGDVCGTDGDCASGRCTASICDAPLFSQTASLVPVGISADTEFGSSVAISGSRLLVGAQDEDVVDLNSGRAYIYEKIGEDWSEVTILDPSDASRGANFGSDVAIDGDRLVVAARRENSDTGSVYVFERQPDDSWDEVAKLVASDPAAGAFFGNAVAIQGDRIVVGSIRADGVVERTGAVYVFERQSDGRWVEFEKLFAADGETSDTFGSSVDLEGDRLIVGAPGADGVAWTDGVAYIFDTDADGRWTQSAKLIHADASDIESLGNAVALAGDVAFVGNQNTAAEYDPGGVHIFERQSDDMWNETQVLVPDDAQHDARFGRAIGVSDGYVVIGAYGHDEYTGAAYVFQGAVGSPWVQRQRLAGSPLDGVEYFGDSVAIDRTAIIVGVERGGTDSEGSAHVFER